MVLYVTFNLTARAGYDVVFQKRVLNPEKSTFFLLKEGRVMKRLCIALLLTGLLFLGCSQFRPWAPRQPRGTGGKPTIGKPVSRITGVSIIKKNNLAF